MRSSQITVKGRIWREDLVERRSSSLSRHSGHDEAKQPPGSGLSEFVLVSEVAGLYIGRRGGTNGGTLGIEVRVESWSHRDRL